MTRAGRERLTLHESTQASRFTFARDAVRITRHSAEETHGQAPSESDLPAASV